MKLGVNLTAGTHAPLVFDFVRTQKADFCELLLDNFLHLDPTQLRKELGDIPVAFHIMSSRFMEKDDSSLRNLAARIREFCHILSPIYVSDHIAVHSVNGRIIPLLAECDYETHEKTLLSRIADWQDRIDHKMYFENFPSNLDSGLLQADFFNLSMKKTGCGTLFDCSNALVAELNCGVSISKWEQIYATTDHFHVGGYRQAKEDNKLVIDSHDCEISDESLRLIQRLATRANSSSKKTLVVERDANISSQAWSLDLTRVREALCST